MAIDSLLFEKEGAHFSAFAAIDFPGTTKKIAFRASKIKFNPSGVVSGEQAKLYLVGEQYIKVNSAVTLHLFAKNKNWVEWDCGGFKAINLCGEFLFRKTKLVPAEQTLAKSGVKGSTVKDSVVRATFEIYTEDIHNFIATASISPFEINGLKGWSFAVENAIIDMSELSNSPAMALPARFRDRIWLHPNCGQDSIFKSATMLFPLNSAKPKEK